jgi:hypothetical protein
MPNQRHALTRRNGVESRSHQLADAEGALPNHGRRRPPRVSRPLPSGDQVVHAQWLICLWMVSRSLPKFAVTWQNGDLSFRIMEEDAMDRLDAMSTFLDVVEAGSLSAAARRLKMPLTTVSRNVSELELHLRTKLFNRSSRQLVLTERGQLLFDRMQTHSRGRDRSRAHGLR